MPYYSSRLGAVSISMHGKTSEYAVYKSTSPSYIDVAPTNKYDSIVWYPSGEVRIFYLDKPGADLYKENCPEPPKIKKCYDRNSGTRILRELFQHRELQKWIDKI